MTDKMDMALDDIVKTMKKPRQGGGRGGGRGSNRGGQRRGGGGRGFGGQRRGGGGQGFGGQRRGGGGRGFGGQRQGGGGGRQSIQTSGPVKLTITNLQFGVTDSDLKELFSEFGSMKSAVIHYNKAGASLGTAHVTYGSRGAAINALKQYNGVHLDGRPMKINIEGGTGTGAASVGVKRLGQGPRGRVGNRGGNRGGSRGGRGRGGRGGRTGQKEKPKTAEELDAEMDAYLNKKPTTADSLDKELDSYNKKKTTTTKEKEEEAEK